MHVGGAGQDIYLESSTIKHVDKYEYLGVTITKDGRDDEDILRKTRKGRNMIKALHPILWNKNLIKKTKKKKISDNYSASYDVWV